MPHRPADSRLLSNLLSHEKDYVRSLNSQLDYGQSSLSSFSAYAAASPPPASRAIGSVTTALVGAHDALRGYVLVVEEWCEQLKMLKEMEDDVGTIARDREILVDRLIKASKSNNPKRRSLLHSSASNQQNANGFSVSNSTLEQLSFSNSKLNLAQSELQACETHLTEKERVLVQMRESALVGGLKMRCKALVECGWKWAEVGKAGLKALDSSDSRGHPEQPGLRMQKPLPDPLSPYQRPSSDLSSSLAPSQSASQIFHTDVISEQHHPSSGSSSGQEVRAPAPEADIHDVSHFTLHLPPAHAISEEDHYTPPQMRASSAAAAEDELGGSSAEEETDERHYEVHDNPLFSHPSASNDKSKVGSKTRLPLKRQKRQSTGGVATMSTSVSTPLPTNNSAKAGVEKQNNDPFGTSSSTNTYSDDQHDSPRRRKRSTFLGLGALTGLFHKRDHTASMPTAHSSASLPSHLPPSPKKGVHWLTRTDKNLKKAGRNDDSSDEDVERAPVPTKSIPSFLTHVTEPRVLSESRSESTEKEGGVTRPKRAPSAGKKLRKVSDGDAQRKVSGAEVLQISRPSTEGRKSESHNPSKENVSFPPSQSIGNGHILSSVSAPVSRSSTIRSQSAIKSSSSTRPASLDLPSSSARGGRTGVLSDSGAHAPGKPHRRRTSLGHVPAPPTRGQASLLSIIEDVSRQNRQGWLQSNPNNLLVEIKAPKSVYHILDSENVPSSSPAQQATSDTTFARTGSKKESPLRPQIVNTYRKGSISASSSEPSLPLKRLPATPTPAPKVPLRSALRNRSVSPNTASTSSPRAASPLRSTGTATPTGAANLAPPVVERNGTGLSSVKDDDSASLSSAYETGHEDLEDDTPTPHDQDKHPLPNGRISGTKVNGSQLSGSASSTGGTATPPSRRKSVRVSLKPTFSSTPPALADYEEDHTPRAPAAAPDQYEHTDSGWTSRTSANVVWEDSSDEDEEYSRARQMLLKASRKLEKVSRGG